MLTLITGSPGTGKTALVVSMLQQVQDRQIWVNGIADLAIPHIELSDPENWHKEVPDGSLIVIDEVQRLWRPRPPGSRVPEHVAQLETHRHRGLDFIVLTQGPNLLDSNVRSLIGRHIHLRDLGVLGRRWYEWPECADNVRTGWRSAPIKKRYTLPKSIFSSYKSASQHHKPQRSFPVVLAVAVVAVIIALALGWRVYSGISQKASGLPVEQKGSTVAVSQPHQSNAVSGEQNRKLPDERTDFDPRISDRPWTAPAYNDLRVVVRLPVISGAICVNRVCKCYAVGGGYLPDVSSKACEDWADNRPFNPYVLTSGGAVDQPQAAGGAQPRTKDNHPLSSAPVSSAVPGV